MSWDKGMQINITGKTKIARVTQCQQQGLINSLERVQKFALKVRTKTGVPNTSLCYSHATCSPLLAEDTT